MEIGFVVGFFVFWIGGEFLKGLEDFGVILMRGFGCFVIFIFGRGEFLNGLGDECLVVLLIVVFCVFVCFGELREIFELIMLVMLVLLSVIEFC